MARPQVGMNRRYESNGFDVVNDDQGDHEPPAFKKTARAARAFASGLSSSASVNSLCASVFTCQRPTETSRGGLRFTLEASAPDSAIATAAAVSSSESGKPACL